jgi:hypothetical protein
MGAGTWTCRMMERRGVVRLGSGSWVFASSTAATAVAAEGIASSEEASWLVERLG